MLLAERHIIKKGHRFWREIDPLCWQSKNLYNSANYLIRQNWIYGHGYLTYCQLAGISVILQEESYTSASNFLNLDPLPVYGQITEKPVFSGKRIKRGLYCTDKGVLVQSDVIGSYNILRKAFPNAFNRYGIERCVVHPRRINLSK